MLSMWILVTLAAGAVAAESSCDAVARQVFDFKKMAQEPIGIMTSAAGAPFSFSETKMPTGPLINNEFFMDTSTHLIRERTPERSVHSKGSGAFGYFEVTHDITKYCKADLFSEIGKRTRVGVRFSTVVRSLGSSDLVRDVRGVAYKFYTNEGIFDIAGSVNPIYAYKNPSSFASFVHSQRDNPATGVSDVNMFWDYVCHHPESLNVILIIFGDRGIFDGFRHMPGNSVHIYQTYNEKGESYFMKFLFDPVDGIKTFTSEEAQKNAAETNYNIQDLYNAIANGNYPTWNVSIQLVTLEDIQKSPYDLFDVTRELHRDKWPTMPLGILKLNENPINYKAQIESLSFCPCNVVKGIMGSPDKLYESRRLIYRDAAHYRLGGNFYNIPVNCPYQAMTYNRDGVQPLGDNMKNVPNSYPNSFNGPRPVKDDNRPALLEIHQDDSLNFDDICDNYILMSSDEKKRFYSNIVAHLGKAAKCIQKRVVEIFRMIHPEISEKLAAGLWSNGTSTSCPSE